MLRMEPPLASALPTGPGETPLTEALLFRRCHEGDPLGSGSRPLTPSPESLIPPLSEGGEPASFILTQGDLT